MVLSRVWFRVSRGFCCSERCPGNAAVCAAGGHNQFLVFAAPSHLVAPFRIRGGCIRAHDHGRSATAHSSATQIERKESEQPHPAPDLQRFLLLTSDLARTRTGAAKKNVADRCYMF